MEALEALPIRMGCMNGKHKFVELNMNKLYIVLMLKI